MSSSNKTPPAPSLTRHLLADVEGRYRAAVKTTQPGIVAGTQFIDPSVATEPVGEWRVVVNDGDRVEAGDVLIEIIGTASELAVAEDYAVGQLGFASGIATRAKQFVDACPAGMSIACGGWKKLPLALKPLLRAGLAAVGVLPRLVQQDFIYVNKNAVRLLGGVAPAVAAGQRMQHGPVVIQVKNAEEALSAVRAGAGIIMVDTACIDDLAAVNGALIDAKLRNDIVLAFGGGVGLHDLQPAFEAGANAVDVGRAILDAPLLDLRLEVMV